MVRFGDVRRWRAGPLDDVEQRLQRKSASLLRLADEFDAMATPDDWTGDGADAARAERVRVTDRMERIVAGVAAARAAVGNAVDALIWLRRGVEEAEDLARANGFGIGDDGAVIDVAPPEDVPDEVARERERIRRELVDRVEQILRRAVDIDDDLAVVLGKVSDGEVDDGDANTLAAAASAGREQGTLSVLEPPRVGTPGDNAGWWDTLSAAERRAIIADHPEWIGNRDGIPFAARDKANRARLVSEKARLLAEKERLTADLDDNVFGGLFTDADDRLDFVQEKLTSIAAIERTLDGPDPRQLLLFDVSTERAEAAIANGNVDTADHVAVFTPGLTSNVPDSLAGYDADMRRLRQRTTDELQRYGDGGSVATVTWIGYQAPQATVGSLFSSNSVALDDAAQAGATKLTPFLQGIDAARDTDAHLTALGHSYGSTTTGFALQGNTGVDEAVFFGSPGVGTSDVDNIKVPDGHATYIEARNDPVGDLSRFGVDPSHLAGMRQATTAEAIHPGDGRTLSEVTWHTSYLDDGSTSQYNMAVIAGGMSDRVLSGADRGVGDIASWPLQGMY